MDINKGDLIYWHRLINYDKDYYVSKDKVIINLSQRHYNCAEFHFKHNWLLCFLIYLILLSIKKIDGDFVKISLKTLYEIKISF